MGKTKKYTFIKCNISLLFKYIYVATDEGEHSPKLALSESGNKGNIES